MTLVIGLVVLGAIAWYIVAPLLSGRSGTRMASASDDDYVELQRRRESLYREIVDLDFDYRLGKVGEDDYRNQRVEYLDEAATVLQELDEHYATSDIDPIESLLDIDPDDPLEREIRSFRYGKRRL